MRAGNRPMTHLVFCVLLGLIIIASSYLTDASEPRTALQTSNGGFFARLISLESTPDSCFVTYLSDCNLSVWRKLYSDKVLSGVSVFELTHYDSITISPDTHDYLLLIELGPGSKPSDILDAEAVSGCGDHQDAPPFSIVRSAYLSYTPNSYYGFPEPVSKVLGAPLNYLVEFIGVEDTPAHLAKYHELMSKYFGPANGLLVESGMLHCFVALENIEVLSSSSGAIPWNQIHISDDWDSGGDVNWDSVYVDLFRSEFSCDLDSVLAQLPPTNETRADYHGRLIPNLCVR